MKDSIIPYLLVKTLAKIDNIYEMRLFGYIFAKAQSVMKIYNKDLSDINLQHAINLTRVTLPARYLLQIGDTNYRHIHKAFKLSEKWVDYDREDWHVKLNIIAFPEFKKEGRNSIITFVIHNDLWHALLDLSKGYRLVNLPTYMRLKSTYSVIMYILISQQNKPMTYHIDTLKNLTGADRNKAYKRTSNFLEKVVKAAQRELNRVSPYTFTFTLKRTGRGGVYTSIELIPIKNPDFKIEETPSARERDLDKQRIRLNPEVVAYLEHSCGIDQKGIESIEGIVSQMGDYDIQIRRIAEIKETALRKKITNVAGYVVNAIRGSV